MIITLIAAIAKNGVIGKSGGIPWHIPEDLKRFREITMGHPLVMGRLTFESLPRPLDGRTVIVLSGKCTETEKSEASVCVSSPAEAVKIAESLKAEEMFVCGGESVYRNFLPIADRLLLTEINAEFSGDRFFPPFDSKEFSLEHETFAMLEFPVRFTEYKRRSVLGADKG